MNIKEAKQQIKNATVAYFTKDRFGHYIVPPEKQRPVFLMGPPGIGKTAVLEQIAQELGVGLVSYAMTHHTRQSALGLPFITEKEYGGNRVMVSEYTMSEIIASVYDCMEATGKKEGILFLDEINCVSETLTPSMLQFLQYKTFGRHRVPAGWIVVTAGNPPEYNSAAREFDVVTWDRLKRVDIDPDYDAWKAYACEKGIHPAVLTYLDCRKEEFYTVRATVDGKRFVTARSWSDLSDMLYLYEQHELPVDEYLIGQYLQDPEISKRFSVYYDLFQKYQTDYQASDILAGREPQSVRDRAQMARFDERVSLLGLLIDAAAQACGTVVEREAVLHEVLDVLRQTRTSLMRPDADASEVLSGHIRRLQYTAAELESERGMSSLESLQLRCAAELLETYQTMQGSEDRQNAFAVWRSDFTSRTNELQKQAAAAASQLDHLFRFCESVFPGGQELIIVVTELTIRPQTAKFIARYGCEGYYRNSQKLQFHQRGQDLLKQAEELNVCAKSSFSDIVDHTSRTK